MRVFQIVPLLCFGMLLQVIAAENPAPLTAVLDERNAAATIFDEDGLLLRFGAYDWGPSWGAAKRRSSLEVEGETLVAHSAISIPDTGGTYSVVTKWKRTGDKSLHCSATITGDSDTALTLSVLTITPAGFAGGNLVVTQADGRRETFSLPLGKQPIGSHVQSLEFSKDGAEPVRVSFLEPVEVAADRDVRIILAKDQITKGQTATISYEINLPSPTNLLLPGQPVPDTQPGWYPFTAESPIPEKSEWRLTDWLEAPAGKHGRIAAEGDQLIYNGKPVRLWGINLCYSATAPDRALAERRADFYAALGINAVRLHKYADGAGWAGILAPGTCVGFDPSALDRMDYFVAALKKRGIYVKLSPVFILKPGELDREKIPYLDEFERAGGGKDVRFNPRHGSIYVSRELQDLLVEQFRALLTHRNPHTGLTYAEDPAVAYVELYNEDSALFGGVTAVLARSATLRARTAERFAKWLREKYGTEEAFRAAWGPQGLNNSILENQGLPLDESFAENRIYPAGNPWFFDPDNLNTSQAPYKRRLLDTMLFLKELQDETYARLAGAIRSTGYNGELIASNWHAGRQMSHFYNLHSDSLLGTIDRHNYFGDGSRGPSGPINAASMLSVPGGGSFSSSLNQVAGHPFMLSEWIHVFANEWGVEGPAILGAYGMGLQGWDVSFAFQNSDDGTWSRTIGAESWDATAPHFLGIFPAVSRQVLRGDVAPAAVIHKRHVNLASLDEERVGFEERSTQEGDVKTFESDVFPSAALAVARGLVQFTETFTPTPAFAISEYRESDGVLRSATGQLRWRPGKNSRDGHIEINTPGTQAVVGFAEGRRIELADATIAPRSRFGAIYLTAKSPQGTLANDRSILIAAVARARNKDQRVLDDVYLVRSGAERTARESTVVMEPVVAEIALKRAGTPIVHVLDQNGVRTGKTLPVKQGKFTIDTGRDQTPYYLVTW